MLTRKEIINIISSGVFLQASAVEQMLSDEQKSTMQTPLYGGGNMMKRVELTGDLNTGDKMHSLHGMQNTVEKHLTTCVHTQLTFTTTTTVFCMP